MSKKNEYPSTLAYTLILQAMSSSLSFFLKKLGFSWGSDQLIFLQNDAM
jgi:hypothetical protein